MSSSRITIRLIGSDVDGGHVRLTDFLDELSGFCDTLAKLERMLSGRDKASLYYRIVDLSHQSPATVVLEAVKPKGAPIAASVVVRTFKSDLRALSKRKPPNKVDLEVLESYGEIAVPFQRNLRRVEVVERGSKIIPIDSSFTEKVEHVIGPDSFAFGTVSGRLEQVNLHRRAPTFQIFPTVGPRRVKCEFKSSDLRLRARVKLALDTYVTVHGRLRYKQWDEYPHTIDAKDIDIHETQGDLPSLNDLRGVAPDATGPISADEFVRAIRDANW
jgi:hypothetical protein